MPRPDDGLIHSWLDGQLSPDEATRVEQLVATDAAWAEAAAEARGLIAASSRILSALDYAPSGVMPKRPAAPAPRRLPWWTKMAAAVVLMAGASTLLLRRAPEVVRVTPAAKPAELVTVPSAPTVARQATPAPTPATKQVQLTRKDVASVAAAATLGMAPSIPAPAPVLAAPAPSVATQIGAMAEQQAKVAVAAEQATRQQVMDQARQRAAQVPMQRTAAEPAAAEPTAAKAFAGRDAAPAPSPNLVGGVAAEKRVAFTARPGACYRLRDSRTSDEVGTVMRIGRIDGDTLRLESLQAASPLRAWVVLRDGAARGVLTTAPEGRGMVLVTALPVSCPAP